MDAQTAASGLDPGLAGRDARPVAGVDNGYVAGYRVRFDEAGPDGNLRASALLRYAQDVAWRHSEHLGFDRAWYADRNLGWVVRGVQLELLEAIRLGTTLRVSTAVAGHRRIWARRLGECRTADHRLVARVVTDWVLLDARNRVVRIPDDFGLSFPNPEIRAEITRVATLTGMPSAQHAVTVRPSDLDPLDHVNNAVYVDWLAEALEATGWHDGMMAAGSALRLEYVLPAARGDSIVVELVGPSDAWHARIRRANGVELLRAAREPLSDAPFGA